MTETQIEPLDPRADFDAWEDTYRAEERQARKTKLACGRIATLFATGYRRRSAERPEPGLDLPDDPEVLMNLAEAFSALDETPDQANLFAKLKLNPALWGWARQIVEARVQEIGPEQPPYPSMTLPQA